MCRAAPVTSLLLRALTMGLARAGSSACVSRRANKALGGRSAYWSQQFKSGRHSHRSRERRLLGNAAVMVFEAASCEEAETICRSDAHRSLGAPLAPLRNTATTGESGVESYHRQSSAGLELAGKPSGESR